MTKLQFLLALHDKLAGLPRNEVEERLNFYSEMIEDRMEDGLSEEEAVAAVGSIDEIAEQITADIPLIKIVKEKPNSADSGISERRESCLTTYSARSQSKDTL